MKQTFRRLKILVPLIIAGVTLLAFLVGRQMEATYGQTSAWAVRFWALSFVLLSAGLGIFLTRLLLGPQEKFVRRTQSLLEDKEQDGSEENKESEDTQKTPSGLFRKAPSSEKAAFERFFDDVSQRISETQAREQFPEFVGESAALRHVLGQIVKIAPRDITVLLRGESGTGKELAARAIHRLSPRAKNPWVEVNCAAIPHDLLESELFGHERGAFTGAVKKRMGSFEQAHGGTLFLDEIGDMSLDLQGKLLRVLQEERFQRVGGNKVVEVDVRIIAATNKDLEGMVREGTFREDLYYRLNVFPIVLPPLRKRREDIPLLVDYFLRLNDPEISMDDRVVGFLASASWPGNIRELANILQQLAIHAEGGQITVSDLPQGVFSDDFDAFVPSVQENQDVDTRLAEMEKQMIEKALSRAGGVQARAAEILGIKQRSLWHRVSKFGIDVKRFKK
jgi:transcriptional regulator with GAF, ATPase, and Fis domain